MGKLARVASPSSPQIPPLKGLAFLVVVLGRRHPTPGARCYPPLTPSRAWPPRRGGPGRGAAAAVDSDTAGFPRPPPGSSRLLRASGARPLPTSPKEGAADPSPYAPAYARQWCRRHFTKSEASPYDQERHRGEPPALRPTAARRLARTGLPRPRLQGGIHTQPAAGLREQTTELLAIRTEDIKDDA